jgi:hypothetical protein
MTHAADDLQNAASQKFETDGGCILSHQIVYTTAKKLYFG